MEKTTSNIRVRFAPSPTGYLHVGGARTALFTWLYASHTSGQFLLRIEDTDETRSTDEFLQSQLGSLKWLGLHWHNPDTSGQQLYRQSQNLERYKKYAEKLLNTGQAFYCFCTEEELTQKKQNRLAQGHSPHYDGTCHKFSLEEAKAKLDSGESATIRFKVPTSQSTYLVKDSLRGDVSFPADMVGDFVILRSNGMPVYNFCCVIDDYLMKITHVFRSEEHLSNTLRQIMLYKAFQWDLPEFVHLSLILGPDKKKLSKRHGATSCEQYRKRGFLPEAMINYLALLGWRLSDDRELFSVQDLITHFTLDRVHTAPAIFDEEKLLWMNAHYLRSLSHQELWDRITPFLESENIQIQQNQEWKQQSLELLKKYMQTLADAPALYKLLLDPYFSITDEGLETLQWPESKAVISAWQNTLTNFSANFLSEDDFIKIQKKTSNAMWC